MTDAKLLYLILLREGKTFAQLQSELFLDSTATLHKSLRQLATQNIIYSHPLILVPKPNRHTYAKLRALNLEVQDKGLPVLLWALSEDEGIVRGKPDSYYATRLKSMAFKCSKDIENHTTVIEVLQS